MAGALFSHSDVNAFFAQKCTAGFTMTRMRICDSRIYDNS